MLTYCYMRNWKFFQVKYYYKLKSINIEFLSINWYYIKIPIVKVCNNTRKKANSFFGAGYSLAQYDSY